MKERKKSWKDYAKVVMTKLPVFIFCVIFISGYSHFFGQENSIVGVILLMGLLMLMKADFWYSSAVSGGLIAITFIGIGGLALLAGAGLWWGLLCHIIAMVWMLAFVRYDVSHSLYLHFFMGYVMFVGYPVSGHSAELRMLSLIIIGTAIGLIHFVLNRSQGFRHPFREMWAPFSLKEGQARWATTLGVTLVLTLFLGEFMGLSKTMWMALSVVSLLTPLEDEVHKRQWLRVPATLLGCLLFFTLFRYLIPESYQSTVVLMAGFMSMFINSYFIKTIYNSFSALVTATLIMLTESAIWLRILENIIGSIIAVAATYLFAWIWKKQDGGDEYFLDA
ncbi:FUSC family protein [Eubacterium aggregans]|uniref:FUSC family protein n=1 Tax=Eubacterium aggregans TaxID=81409 RepID=UPI003F2C837C